MPERTKSRPKIPRDVESSVLTQSRRRCALCYHLNNDLSEKRGQIAHLDGNPSNNAIDNLAFLCLDHHSLFDSRTSQHKNYSIDEAKAARRDLYTVLANGLPTVARAGSLPLSSPPAGTARRERYEEWRELRDELHGAFYQIGYAFSEINVITPGVEDNDPNAGIRRGYNVIRNRILIAAVLKEAQIEQKYTELVQYAHSAWNPREPNQRGCPTVVGFDAKARALEDEILELARKDTG